MTHRPRQKSLPGMESPLDEPPQAQSSDRTDRGGKEVVEGKESGAEVPAPESLEGKTIYVVDAHSLIHQVFHAIPEMTSPTGGPVGAVYGFARDLLYLLERQPDYLFCAFDLPGKTFRHEIYDQYKAHRPEMHPDLAAQIPLVQRFIDALGVGRLACPAFEADDILATMARQSDQLGSSCFLVTGDKDCRQLLTDCVKIFNIRKTLAFDSEDLMREWGIRPDQVVDFQALVGDSSDNIPGVPLIGPKLARQLLEKYDTLDGLLAHAGEISGKRGENLRASRDQALMSRQLARLDTNVPIKIDWEAGRVGRIDRERTLELFAEFGFRTLGERVDALQGTPSVQPNAVEICCQVVDTPEALSRFAVEISQEKCFSVDLETTHIMPFWAEIVGLAFAASGDRAWYVPVRAPDGEAKLDPAETLEVLRPVLEDSQIEKIGQNLKYDMIVLRKAGVNLAGVAFDTMVASYLLDAGQ